MRRRFGSGGRGLAPFPLSSSLPCPAAGWTLVELVVLLAVAAASALLVAPAIERVAAGTRVRLAAGEVATALRETRMSAVRLGTNVAIRFEVEGERVSFRLYADGDGDGVRNADIRSGVDRPLAQPRTLRHLGRHVGFGIPEHLQPSDPGDPRRRLERVEDPVRFNRSDLAAFGPLGTSTPGSLYLSDGRSHLAVVRVFNRTGKVKTLRYDPQRRSWHPW